MPDRIKQTQRVFLLVVDQSAELKVALRFASRRAKATGGRVAMLYVTEPANSEWLGVGEIINGNIDYMFKPVGQDFEGLSNALNVMLARLLGREEVSDEEGEDEADEANKWKSEQMLVEEASAAADRASQ